MFYTNDLMYNNKQIKFIVSGLNQFKVSCSRLLILQNIVLHYTVYLNVLSDLEIHVKRAANMDVT